MTQTTQPSGKLIFSAKTEFQEPLSVTTRGQDIDFCNMYANYTGKQTLNFYDTFQNICQNTYTGDGCTK